ncbi:MAG: 30S ribosomal protein S6 [Planctomycetaceae bacterium]
MSVAEAKPVRENQYEGMFLVDSGKFAMDSEGVVAQIMAVLKRAGANVVAHRPWQDGKLAYEIEGMKKGLHYIVCFTMPSQGMTVLNRQAHLNETIVRHMVIRHPKEVFEATVAAITGSGASEESAEEGESAPTDEGSEAAE